MHLMTWLATEAMAQEAFAKMDQHLDLLVKKESLMNWTPEEMEKFFPTVAKQLPKIGSKLIERVQWSKTAQGLYREDLPCVPED